MGPLGGDEAHLFDGLTAAAKGNCVALMAISLDAIGIDMHHQSTDLAAGTGGDRHGRERRGTPAKRPPPELQQGLRQQPGLILAAAWVGAVWKGAYGVPLAIPEGPSPVYGW